MDFSTWLNLIFLSGVIALCIALLSTTNDQRLVLTSKWKRRSVLLLSSCLLLLHTAQLGVLVGVRFVSWYTGCSLLLIILTSLLLALLVQLNGPRRLWNLSGILIYTLLLHIWYLINAVQSWREDQLPKSAWLEAHLPIIWLAACSMETCLLVGLLALTVSAAIQASRKMHSGLLWEPLLNGTPDAESGRHAEVGKRWKLVYGVLQYVWPDSFGLQLRFMGCFVLVFMGRVVNLAVPLTFKRVVDTLSDIASNANKDGLAATLRALCSLKGHVAVGSAPTTTLMEVFLPWVAAYLALYFLQGGSGGGSIGLLSNLRQLLWIPITQRAYKRVSLDVFKHLLDLDHSYHLKRNTGKVMRILDRGTSSIQDVMSVVLFSVVPQLIDVVAACIYMAAQLQPWTAVIVFITVATYIPLTFIVTEWRGKVRKRMNLLDNEKEGKATDMLLNYETVKVFGNERFELNQFGNSIDAYQGAEFLQMACIALLNIGQSAVVFSGLAMGLIVCVRGIVAGQLTVGDAVLFLTLMNQLYTPLSFFGSYYRQVQKGFIDMENMFDLLHTQPAVQNLPHSKPLNIRGGEVSFQNVTFGYSPARTILKGVTFNLEGGKTLALVGPTGSGKSTVLRLLLRFWDPQLGRVQIDGSDIRNITLASLRAAIAVVPQDSVLFNDTLRYNIRYGRPNASNEEVEEAAKVAAIHETITQKFRKGYDTVVGERGLRLSGGEKQRVCTARAVLHRPAILVLDEATSALDSMTERMIQDSLAQVRQTCTTIIVAHRLSTVMDADLILVFDNGEVIEQGSHQELLRQGESYALMWQRQQDMGASNIDLSGLTSSACEVEQPEATLVSRNASNDDNEEEEYTDNQEVSHVVDNVQSVMHSTSAQQDPGSKSNKPAKNQ